MAPAIAYNSFHLVSSSSRSKPYQANVSRKTITSSAAKQNAFSFGRRQKAEDESPATEQTKPNNGFFFDFGKIPDPKSLVPIVSSPSSSLFGGRRKDPGTVFVAGATGQAGVRIVQSLLRQGFAVRAGVPNLPSAQELARLASTYKIISSAESKRLNAVESAFDSGPESIAKAIGPAGKVVVTIGPAENGPLGEVTTNNALEVILAAQLSKVDHVAVVYDSVTGVSNASSTGNVLDGITTFFSNLFSGSQSLTLSDLLNKIAETDVSYTLIKTSLTEDFSAESSYGLVVSKEGGSTAEFKVSRSQIARLVADVFSNTSISENKVVEVSASPSAPSKSIVEIFSAIPEDGRRKAYAEAAAKATAEEALIATERAREREEAAKTLKEEAKTKTSEKEFQADNIAKEAQEKAVASLNGFLNKAKDFSGDFSWDNLSSKFAAAVPQNSEEEQLKTQIATVRGQAKARKLTPKKAVVKQITPKPKPKPKSNESELKPEVRKVFGGLFKQETIYIDDE